MLFSEVLGSFFVLFYFYFFSSSLSVRFSTGESFESCLKSDYFSAFYLFWGGFLEGLLGFDSVFVKVGFARNFLPLTLKEI